VRYTGELGLGHEYTDAPNGMSATVADVFKRIYSNKGLEIKANYNKEFDLEMERSSECILATSQTYPSRTIFALTMYLVANLKVA
jgi:hypothetical protein